MFCVTFSVVDQLKNKTPAFFEAKFTWVGAGSGLGIGFELGLFSETSILTTLEPHVANTNLSNSYVYTLLGIRMGGRSYPIFN